MQFPVSSGQIHRLNESEWVPVEPAKPSKPPKEDKKLVEKQTEASSSTMVAAKLPQNDDIPLPTTGAL